jgi:hypothetical protein
MSPAQCSAVQCSAVQCSAVQCIVPYTPVLDGAPPRPAPPAPPAALPPGRLPRLRPPWWARPVWPPAGEGDEYTLLPEAGALRAQWTVCRAEAGARGCLYRWDGPAPALQEGRRGGAGGGGRHRLPRLRGAARLQLLPGRAGNRRSLFVSFSPCCFSLPTIINF